MEQELRQRHAGMVWSRVLPALVLPPVLVFGIFPQVLVLGGPAFWALGVAAVTCFLYVGLQPIMWWWGADLRIDDEGLHFGTRRPRRKPAQITFAARNPYDAGWSAVSDVRLLRSRSAVAAMCKEARGQAGPPQPTRYAGYFPARSRAALVFHVEGVAFPEIKPSSKRRGSVGKVPGVSIKPSATWVFPVRRVEPVLAALQAHGVLPTEIDQPVPSDPPPVGAVPVTGPDDPFVLDIIIRNLGRPPTEAELERFRRDWNDAERFPHRPPETRA